MSQGFALDLGEHVWPRLGSHERVSLGVRPEDVVLSATEFAGGTPARVYVTEVLGNESFVFLNLGQQKIVARTEAAAHFDIESPVWVSFNPAKLHFFDSGSGARLP